MKLTRNRIYTAPAGQRLNSLCDAGLTCLRYPLGGGPRVVASTAAFHARVRGSVAGFDGLKETKNVSSPSTWENQYCWEPP